MQPKNSKYRKTFRGRRRGVAERGSKVDFGEYGLKSLGRGWLSAKQLEAARRTIAHATSRGGKVWLRVFPHKPITSRGAGVRMGGGKGDISEYVAVITPGRILFEIAGISEELTREAFRKASAKLPFPTIVVGRH
ncbi:MAG: 50S ribosomal protein L16 [Candidatus Blackburnbacteria bacterium RIFCSPHIGHO2_01_FULL_44_64]|uniref:50S ribosomal protein L16 n=1 Tax=Candidatus Blackburnbacteria bacterium RIFCSPHIGHO2_02_FULL_44_20 TaxID=1797516 RepID=A0A1G1V8W9_9BACT|nr:MAG: 50S ribosomal protein L16 [Candidatus Blackburnbacteria bacterium RIFCSPHIGHO2_01_FULL_44_64]OGY11818.1 MAG: 50S ribosomal protein L16 [Candidatus Blackburnbacteria bacterium RIFCSPHIGHO2_12_FULL_44_25]OGY11865.1 MAG: 50S ribosomal protein L16 [Candidatus Blackburnbacteria bacterium RIFCSPHIGHO2_02_FULL_44_20]OGY14474.1 MAG: 50S ribosomal protein L16 [Candidatus Blackburnbacteria bacterium RIFCSPLOWO2_01_FULL_44_43]OGY16021.1 MAG: 50S ribosomal protein L16 [Candidatus Blackburnbacteria 